MAVVATSRMQARGRLVVHATGRTSHACLRDVLQLLSITP